MNKRVGVAGQHSRQLVSTLVALQQSEYRRRQYQAGQGYHD